MGPGLTALAQVSGRNAVSWDQRLALDVEYVDTHTLRGDLAIIARTVSAVLRRDGISAEDSVTMPGFMGRHWARETTEPQSSGDRRGQLRP